MMFSKSGRIFPHLLVLGALAGIVLMSDYLMLGADRPVREVHAPLCRPDQSPCHVQIEPGMSVVLTLSPQPVPAGSPFFATVMTEGIRVREVALEFEGADMNMGLFTQNLAARGADGRHFESSLTLPLCATGAMRWQARLVLRADHAAWNVPFQLTTGG